MKKKPVPLLLPLAVLTLAAAGVVVFIMLRAAHQPGDTTEEMQGRAHAAASEVPMTEDEDYRASRDPDNSGAAAAAALPSARAFAETARGRTSRRNFLMQKEHWQGENAKEIARAAEDYRSIRRRWAGWMLAGRTGSPFLAGQMTKARTEVDRLLADHSSLTAEAESTLGQWEQIGWRGFERPQPSSIVELEILKKTGPVFDYVTPQVWSDDPPAQQAANDFAQRRDAVIVPLLDQLEELQTDDHAMPPFVLFNSAEPEVEETPAQGAERRHLEALGAQIREQLDDYMSKWQLLQGRWKDRDWEGYAESSAASPDSLPAPPRLQP